MSVMQINQELSQLQRSVNDQLSLLDGFRRSNEEQVQLVRRFLRGSTQGHDARALASLDAALDSLSKSEVALRTSLDAMRRVQLSM